MIVLLFGIGSIVRADTAVLLGVGQLGTWSTTGYVTNQNSSTEELTITDSPVQCVLCPVPVTHVPPLGSVSLDSFLNTGLFQTLYITQVETQPPAFPLVHVRLVNSLDFGGAFTYNRSVDIPVVLLSRLISANLSTLNFGGVVSGQLGRPCVIGQPCFTEEHSTLVLGNIQRPNGISGEDLPANLDLFDSDGNLIGSGSLTIPYGQTAIIGNVAGYLGAVGVGFSGQLRITRTSGSALMWAILYSVDFNGTVTASAGVNLSPW